MINLNNVNKFIPYKHFKMEGLHCLKFLVEQDDLLCKKNLKEAHLPVPLNKNSQKFARFQWSDNIYEFLSLCFGLGPALSFFTELSKVTIVLLRLVNIRIIFYLDGMLLTGRTLPETLLKRASKCQEIFKQPKTSVLNLTKLIGMSSTVQAILTARIQFRYL